MMKFLPACFFPTKILLVDDDVKFLTELNYTVDTHTATYQTYTNPNKALSFIQQFHQTDTYLDKWFSDGYHKIKNHDYSHRHQVYTSERYTQVSTIVSDYSMPEMNGLEFLSRIQNPHIRKIILTGEADESIAIGAFNDGLIHGFIRKSDPKAIDLLNAMINKSQVEFFQSLTRGYLEAIKENIPDTLLQFSGFISIFEEILKQRDIVEYYLLDSIGKFLLVDSQGNFSAVYAYGNDEKSISESYLEADAYFVKNKEFVFPEIPATLPAFLNGKKSTDRINGREETPHHDFPIYNIPEREEIVWGYVPKLISCKEIISFNAYKKSIKHI